MKPGDNIKIKKGPYADKKGTLRSRCNEHDQRTGETRKAWTVWINGVVELIYEDELEITK